ncbi:hypothetical protein [Azospirillum sp.]|uniref:hypothetical protein n=1 Tax=Azospirillum sp. TaxID=34012 RepID=UPI002D33081F|nr:hypothetical protein [Azospirillum sp.]HYD66126.1 hypothetical protein [Azospirillum sp.]
MSLTDTHARQMSLAEADHCCGKLSVDEWTGPHASCDNCPLLIERKREHALKLARAN